MADCKLSTCRTFNMHLDAAKAIKIFFILNPNAVITTQIFPFSSWQPVPRLLAAACRHLARRFFLT